MNAFFLWQKEHAPTYKVLLHIQRVADRSMMDGKGGGGFQAFNLAFNLVEQASKYKSHDPPGLSARQLSPATAERCEGTGENPSRSLTLCTNVRSPQMQHFPPNQNFADFDCPHKAQ